MVHPNGLRNLMFWGAGIAGLWGLNLVVEQIFSPYVFSVIMFAGINVILAVSLNLVNGFTGQFSIGHAGFMAVGGYTTAAITMYFSQATGSSHLLQNFVFFLGLIVGGTASGIVGYIVGLPSLRLKGDYLAIVTLGFGEIIRVVLLNMNSVGGARGLPSIPFYSHFAWVYSWVVVTILVVVRLMGSSQGREFLSVREDEIAAEAMGVNTTRAKVRAFVIGAFFAGVAGGLFGHYLRYLNPAIFDFNRSFEIITMVVLGGMGSITGSVFAALFLTSFKEILHLLKEHGITTSDFRMIFYSLFLILLMLTRPHGLFGRKELIDFMPASWRKRWRGGRSQ